MTVRVDPVTGLPQIQPKIVVSGGGKGGTPLPDQTGNSGKYLKTDGTTASWATVSGGGGGTGTVETIVAGNNIDVDSTDPANPIVAVETLTLADISDVTATATEVNYTDGVTSNIQTQLDGKAALAHTHALAAGATDVTASAAELNILDGATLSTTELNYVDGVTSAIQTQLDGKVDENAAIVGATKTKITYDAKGLVTAGVDATTADIADSANKRYVTDAQLTVISNTSGTNTGDQDLSGYVPTTRTVNGHALSSNVTVTADDVLPTQTGNNGKFLTTNGTTAAWGTVTAGTGDVVGGASSTDNAIARYDGTTGKLIQNSVVTVDDTGNLAGVGTINTKALPTGDIIGSSDTQTLTSKTIALGSNTVSGTTAQFNTALTDGDFATLAGAETLTNKTLTAPKVASGGYISDPNGNENLVFVSVASAVNELTISNNVTGSAAYIAATGGDVNASINLIPKGTGTVQANSVPVVTTTGAQTLTSKTLTAPTIGDFTNATHDHSNAAGGGTLTHTAFPTGAVVQMVGLGYTAVATGTTTIPLDDTIPQNTEGTEFMSLSFTPKSATNTLVIDVLFFGTANTIADVIVALFQDSVANAIAATSQVTPTANYRQMINLRCVVSAGSTSARTYKVRAGGGAASTITFNGHSSGRLFGAITKSSIVITEYKA